MFLTHLLTQKLKEHTEMMSISEMEEYLEQNKHISQVIKSLNIVGGVQDSHIEMADGKTILKNS